jgi:hypothetical protein
MREQAVAHSPKQPTLSANPARPARDQTSARMVAAPEVGVIWLTLGPGWR